MLLLLAARAPKPPPPQPEILPRIPAPRAEACALRVSTRKIEVSRMAAVLDEQVDAFRTGGLDRPYP